MACCYSIKGKTNTQTHIIHKTNKKEIIKQKTNNIILKILPAVLKNYLDYKTTNNKTTSFPIPKSNTRALEKNAKRLESVDFGPEITLLGW